MQLNGDSLNRMPVNHGMEVRSDRFITVFDLDADAAVFSIAGIECPGAELEFAATAEPFYVQGLTSRDAPAVAAIEFPTDARMFYVVGVTSKREPAGAVLEGFEFFADAETYYVTGMTSKWELAVSGIGFSSDSETYYVQGMASKRNPAVSGLTYTDKAFLRHYTTGQDVEPHNFWRYP